MYEKFSKCELNIGLFDGSFIWQNVIIYRKNGKRKSEKKWKKTKIKNCAKDYYSCVQIKLIWIGLLSEKTNSEEWQIENILELDFLAASSKGLNIYIKKKIKQR